MLTLFLVYNTLAQTSEIQFQNKINEYFNSNNFKDCIDSGVKYLELYGSDSLKSYLMKVGDGLKSYTPNNFEQINKNITKVIELSPKIIPLYAIYCGLGEVTFGMMYRDNLSSKDKRKILNFSTSYLYKALDFVTTDSYKTKSIIYQKMANILSYYGDKGSADAAIMLSFKYDPDNYEIGLKVASYYERIGMLDSTKSILLRLYHSLKNKNTYQNFYDFLGDHLYNSSAKINYYTKALLQGVRDPSTIYGKIADGYFPNYPDSSLKYYQKSLKFGSGSDKIFMRLGLLYNLKIECRKAIEYFNKVKSWKDKPAIYADSFAGCYANEGEYNKAIKLYKLSKNHSQIAYSYLNLKYYRQAIDIYLLDIKKAKSKKWPNYFDKKNYLSWHYYNLAKAYAIIDARTDAYNALKRAYTFMDKSDATSLDLKYSVEKYRILKNNTDWDYLSNDNEFLYLYQKSGIKKIGKLLRVWIKKVVFPYQNDRSIIDERVKKNHPFEMAKYGDYQYTMSFYEFNIPKQKARCLRSLDYANNGECINSYNYENPEWKVTFMPGINKFCTNNL